MNKAILCGNAGGEPVVRETSSGKKVASLSLATNEVWRDAQGQKQEKTSWHRLVFWGRLAEIVEEYINKGSKILVEGRVEYGSYVSKETEQEVKTTEIVVSSMEMLGSKGNRAAAAPKDKDNDLPF